MFSRQRLLTGTAGLVLSSVLIFTTCGGGSGESSGGSTGGASTTKAITSFYFISPAATGIIDHVNHTIKVTVPYGTDVTGLIASFVTIGTSVRIVETGLIQTAGITSNNFSNPLTYQVIAADNSMQNYTVTVTVAANNAKAITSFIFPSLGATGVINEVNHSIMVSVPFGTSSASLSPAITHTGTAISPESGVARNFNNPVTYTVTAEDNSTQKYTVTVTIAANSAKAITSFTFASPAATGFINETNHTVNVEVPYGTNITSLVPAIIHTGASISPASGIARNFSNAISYAVTAADLSTQNYTVTVTIAANSAKAITAFDFFSPAATGIINEINHTITIAVPYETDVTSLTPVITHTGASISPASGTALNFTTPVIYTVTAANSSTQNYTVTVGRLAEITTMEIAGNLAFTLNIAGIFAEGGGNVINEGDSAVTERGIVWNASGNPTINDSKASDGSGPGEFYEASMTNLVENTTYYVRAYAINSQGTAYGNEIMFNSGFICGTEYAGGYVLYNDGNGGGLVSAMNDQSESYTWITGGTTQSTLNGNTSADIGTGQDNSDAIIDQTGHIGSAAQICLIYDDGTYSD
ncbi:MAG: hypothetical protein JXN64_00045 [Spirochaetes bacterium]|nr:hypothetical protein [Spirochaetota bacterium]